MKLLKYLKEKYGITRVLYFGGVETHTFKYDYLENETVPIEQLERHVTHFIQERGKHLNDAALLLISRICSASDSISSCKSLVMSCISNP